MFADPQFKAKIISLYCGVCKHVEVKYSIIVTQGLGRGNRNVLLYKNSSNIQEVDNYYFTINCKKLKCAL